MCVVALTVTLYAPWVHSLKEKRAELRSLMAKTRNKFNVSVAEIEEQDIHQKLAIGIAAVAANSAQADSIAENLLRFLQVSTEAEIVQSSRELY